MNATTKTYWHFVKDDRLLGYGDGRFVEPGKTYSIPDTSRPIELCAHGMHAFILGLEI